MSNWWNGASRATATPSRASSSATRLSSARSPTTRPGEASTLSEDLAQETFVAAWKQLPELREPSQLRAWLCGIARFRVGKELRRRGHEPSSGAEPLDTLHDSPTPEPSPSAQAVTREEEAILWRALERIPETYREPLILFYREQQSVERVAAELELTEDAVKQRLSRGRKLLHEEVIAFVEGTLSRTAPGEAFSGAVLAALPMAAASTAASTAGAAAAKSGAFAWLAPVLGILGGMFAHWLVVQGSPTEAERRAKKISFASLWVFILAWCVGGQIGLRALSKHFQWTDRSLLQRRDGLLVHLRRRGRHHDHRYAPLVFGTATRK